MKRILFSVALATAIAASALFAGCSPESASPTPPPQTQTTQEPAETTKTPILSLNTALPPMDSIPTPAGDAQLSAEFDSFRINHTGDTYYSLVTGYENFTAMIEGKIYDQEQRDLLSAKYDEEFFSTHMLIVVEVEYGSGSISTKLAGADLSDGKVNIRLESSKPEVGTCDMAQWLLIIALDSSEVSAETPCNITLDGRPIEQASPGSRI